MLPLHPNLALKPWTNLARLPKDDDALKSDNLGINIDLSIKYQGQIMYRCTHVLYSKPWPTSGSDDNQHKPCSRSS